MGNGLFKTGFARGLAMPRAIVQFVSALIEEAAASPVKH